MPIPTDYQDICAMLLEATREGRVKWHDRGFAVGVPQGGLFLDIWSGTSDATGTDFVAVGLRGANPSDELVDNFWVSEGDPDYAMMNELARSAKRAAKGVNKKLDELRKTLKGGGPVG